MDSIDKLRDMVNKPFIYSNEEVVILGFCDCTGDNGDEIEIYLSNGKTLIFNMCELITRLERFRPITKNVIIVANEKLNQVSSVNPSILKDMRDLILSQIKAVKDDPAAIGQAKQVFQGVNTLINLAKTELEYKKYVDQTLKQ